MKRLLLLTLLATGTRCLSSSTLTQRDMIHFNQQITAAQNQATLKNILTTIYATYGDPNNSDFENKVVDNADTQWKSIGEKLGITNPFFTYDQYIAANKPASTQTPTSGVTQSTQTPQQTIPTRTVQIQNLSGTQFVEQLTEQVTKSLQLLTRTLQDPQLSQEVTSDQKETIQGALKQVAQLLDKAGD